MKQLIHIHGGDSFATKEAFFDYWRAWQVDNPFDVHEEAHTWKQWLMSELEGTHRGVMLRMPNSMDAHYDEWAMWFDKFVPFFMDYIVLVGHSLGANFLAKYLNENRLPVRVSQLHLVAGSYGEHDFVLPETLPRVAAQCERIHMYHSTDDRIVPFADAEKFKTALPEAELVTFTDRGHFLQPEFPELLERIQKTD